MPDELSAEADPRSIDDLINKMLVPPGLGPGPSPEFIQRNPRAAGAMRMRELSEPNIRNDAMQKQIEQQVFMDSIGKSAAPTDTRMGPGGKQFAPAIKIGPNGEIIWPKE